MKKLSSVIRNKLAAQAEEAKDRGLISISDGIMRAISVEGTENTEYSYVDLKKEIHNEMWKIAAHLISYYNPESANAEKIDGIISTLSSTLIDELEKTMGVSEDIKGPWEPKVPGES